MSDRTMAGKTCLVTGATAGIGAVTARELARLGARVIIVGRSREKCEASVDAIQQATGSREVEFLLADLSSQADIRRMASEFLARHDRLHVLVNNAGAMYALRRESVDGVEMTLALNHLGYFLLTKLLLDAIKASTPSRIVNVASGAHADVRGFDFDDPQAQIRAGGARAYPRSEAASLMYTLVMPWAHPAFLRYAETKLANLLFTYELARRLHGTGVTVNALHPGVVATSFSKGNGALGWFIRQWDRLRAISSEQGARTSIFLATSPQVDGVTGKYFVDCTPAESSAASRDEAAAQRLWRLSEELTQQRVPAG